MKKWTACLFALLAVFLLAASACAEPAEEYLRLELPAEQEQREPNFLLWQSDYFEVHTNIVRDGYVLFYYDETAEPIWVWVDGQGYGEAWFTPGTMDAAPYALEGVYDEDNPVQHYSAHLACVDDNDEIIAESESVAYTAGLTSAETPLFAPTVTDVTTGALRQDGMFSLTVSNEAPFDVMCVALFDEQGDWAVDSHWVYMDGDAEPTVIETPLLKLEVNRQYTAKLCGLVYGQPMAFAEESWELLVLSPEQQAEGTDIRLRGLKEEYLTGEPILPVVYYPNSEGMENIVMEIAVYAERYENTHRRWDRDMIFWPDETGAFYYQPESWDEPIRAWDDGAHVFDVKIWLRDGDDYTLLDGFSCGFSVTGSGPMDYDPELPVAVEAESLPCTFTVRRPEAERYSVYGEVFDLCDETYHELFWYDNEGDEPMNITLTSPSQRAYVHIEAEREGYDYYEREAVIPVVGGSGRLELWTDVDGNEPLPLHTGFALWVSAPGADWIRVDNVYGQFFWEDDRNRIDSEEAIEFGDNIRVNGDNTVLATAQFTDSDGNAVLESAVLVLQGCAEGEAGAFTAAIDRDNVDRGESVTVTYTESENANHYWVDAERWNEERGEWEWVACLADLEIWGENEGGEASLNTMELVPGKYRLEARAESEGYFAAEAVITDEFIVRDAEIPESGILVAVSADEVETGEPLQVSAYAPGAEWLEIYWDLGNNNRDSSREDGDSKTWDRSFDLIGSHRIAVKAGRDALDENGEVIWEQDDEGHSWKKQEEWWSEPVAVAVSAENGALTLATPDGIPAALAPSDEEELAFTVQKPENAEALAVAVWLDGQDGQLFWDYTWEDTLAVSVRTPLEAGQTLCVAIHAQARGYESADIDLRIPVLEETGSALVQLTIGEGDFPQEGGTYLVPMGGTIRFLVGAAQGHELTAAKLYTPDGWWGGGEEIRQDNHGDWFEGGCAFFHTDFNRESNIGRVVPVYALARLDGSNDWVQSNVIWVRQLGYQIGAYHFTCDPALSVARGEDAVFTFSAAKGADSYWVDAWDACTDNDSYNPRTVCSGTTVILNTAQLPEGEYIIRGRAGTDGMGWREADEAVYLTVTAGTVPEGEVSLRVDKTEALTGEEIAASVYAPGADFVEIFRQHVEGGWMNRFAENGGEGASGSFSEGNEKTVEVYARAHYFERDENGNTVPDVDEYGNEIYRELPYVDSETVTVTVTAPYGPLAIDGEGIPVSAMAGTELALSVPVPENAGHMDWELYLDRDEEDEQQRPDYSGKGALELTIPGSEVVSGSRMFLHVWVWATGYEGTGIDLDIRVLDAQEDRIVLSVSKSEVEVNEEFAVTVTVNAQDVDTIQYHNGNGFWREWDDELQQEVNQNLELDQNGQWSQPDQNYDDAGVKALYARAYIDGAWVESDPVKVTVTKSGRVGAFTAELEQESVTRGDAVTLCYTAAENADESRYELWHDRNRDKDGEDDVPYQLNWQRNEEERTMTILTAGMPAGEYWLRVRAQGEIGYEGRESAPVLLTVEEAEDDAIRLEIVQTEVQTSEDFPVSLYAPGACRMELHWDENDLWSFDGEEYWTGSYSYGDAGVYEVFARVWYPDQEEPVKTESIPITVNSNGQKIPLDLSVLPTSLLAGEDALLSVERPGDSGYMDWEIFLDDGPEPYTDNHRGYYVSLNQTIPGELLHEGGTVHLRIWTGAAGYDNNHQELRIPVTGEPDDAVTLTVSENPVSANRDFTVTVSAPGAAYIQYFAGNDFWRHWDDGAQEDVIENLEPDAEGVWSTANESFGRGGLYTLYARAWMPDAEAENGGYWLTGAPVAVTVTQSGRAGEFDIALDRSRVTRGDLVTLDYTLAEHSRENGYDLHHDRDRSSDGEEDIQYYLNWQREDEEHQIRFSTAGMPAGKYRLSVWASGTEGYEGRESGDLWLTVEEASDNEVRFDVSKSNLVTHEVVYAGVYAPGACRGEIHWQSNEVCGFEGEVWDGRYSYPDAGVYQVFARVWYPEQEEPVDSDMFTVVVSTNGEKLPLDFSLLPVVITANTDTAITVFRPKGAGYMDWELHLPVDSEPCSTNHEGEYEFLNHLIPGEKLREGDMVFLRIWTGAPGYDNNYREVSIPVVGQESDAVTVTLSSPAVETCEDVSCTVSFPAGVYTEIQLFDGDHYRGEEALAEEESSRSFVTDFGTSGSYTLYARLRGTDGAWVYSAGEELTVTAPNGPLTLDVSGVPACLYEGDDVTFTLGAVTDENGDPVAVLPNYELFYDDGAGEQTRLIRWEDEDKTGTITIGQDDIAPGRVYTLNYNVFARGFEPVMDRVEFSAYAAPSVTLSVDKKTVTYGEDVSFTVNAPGASSVEIVWWEDGVAGDLLKGTTWMADELGTFQFGARANYDGFGAVMAARPVSVTVSSLGEAPEPWVDVPEIGDEGAQLPVTIYPEPGEWLSVRIYDSNGDEVRSAYGHGQTVELSVNDALAGTYLVQITYGMDGYDEGQTERRVPVAYSYCGSPEWRWADDLSTAQAVFASLRGDSELPVDAEITSEVTIEPECEAIGTRTYTAAVSYKGETYSDSRSETIDPTEHDWGEPVFVWTETEDGYTAKAVFTCRNDDTHTCEEDAAVTLVRHAEAGCTKPELTVYRAVYEDFSEDKTVEGEAALGHDWEWHIVWNDDYSAYALRKCARCGVTETAEAEVERTVTREATCQLREEVTWSVDMKLDGEHLASSRKQYNARAPHVPGEAVFSEDNHFMYIYCSICGELLRADFYEHRWGEPVYVWAEDYSSVTATRTCDQTPGLPHSETETVTATGTQTKAAACVTDGETSYTSAAFENKAFTVQTLTVEDIPALGHDWGEAVYVWSEDNSEVTATRVCTRDSSHVETETAQTTAELLTSPTENEPGVAAYLALFENPAFSIQEKQAQIPALSGLNVLRLPAALGRIESEAFANLACDAVIIPDGCTAIGEYAFAGCRNLVYVYIPASVTAWPENAFAGCPACLVIDYADN